MNSTEKRYDRYCKELEELNKKVRRKLKQIEDVENKLVGQK
jgi:ABC-type Zn uptake system ZnuABC Zn-binding protein ZnuA